jgi:4-oxalocrotonate tautomerase
MGHGLSLFFEVRLVLQSSPNVAIASVSVSASLQTLNWNRAGLDRISPPPPRVRIVRMPVLLAARRQAMPLVDIQLIKGVFTSEQKTAMIKTVTEAMIAVEGENMRPVTWVRVHEIESGQWAIGGNPLTVADVKAVAAGR